MPFSHLFVFYCTLAFLHTRLSIATQSLGILAFLEDLLNSCVLAPFAQSTCDTVRNQSPPPFFLSPTAFEMREKEGGTLNHGGGGREGGRAG